MKYIALTLTLMLLSFAGTANAQNVVRTRAAYAPTGCCQPQVVTASHIVAARPLTPVSATTVPVTTTSVPVQRTACAPARLATRALQ